MKRYSKFILAGVLLLLLAFLFFARQVGANPLVSDSTGTLTFSGTLEARQTRVSAEVSARVVNVRAKKGDVVKAGDPMVDLDSGEIKTTLSQAEATVRAAQANLDAITEKARAGNVALGEAGVAQAQANLDANKRALEDANRALANPQDLTTQLHVWEGKVAAGQGAVGQAQAALAAVKDEMELAQRDQSAAGKYVFAGLQKQQAAAEATLAAAQADLAGSQRLVELYRDLLKNPLELQAAQHGAANQVKVADAGLQAAQADLALIRAGAQPETVALAQAKLNAAQASLALAQAQAKRYAISSPVAGTIVDRTIEPGETTRPGAALLTIADTREFDLTLYVPVASLNAVRVGQAATVSIPSLPGKSFSGKVTYIAPQSEFKPANLYNSQERSEMVFAIKVTVPNDGSLKAGLPADATLK